jgi:hypothetical protein
MLKTGSKVERLTKKVGQAAPVGTVVAVHGDSVEIKWSDGHTSIIDRTAVRPTKS